MNFRGLFIGIDRYASLSIPWLSCAKNDALALYSLFTDTLGGQSDILVDEVADRNRILDQFDKLKSCNKEDFVVIAFSGHGSNTHELICYDSDPDRLSDTSIPLSELLEYFKAIPAKRVIFIIDCCFSGAIAAKTFKSDIIARDFKTEEFLISQLSGEGKIILTASSPTESAWENNKQGHGFLTYYLIEALQGFHETSKTSKIDVYTLLKTVTEKVTAAAIAIGKTQSPTLRGSIDGKLEIPVLQQGEHFFKNFPKYAQQPISDDLQSLLQHGFPQTIVDIWLKSIPKLNELQLSAINDHKIFLGNHLVVSAPTSSGKTMIGELAAILGVTKRKRAIFLFPLKALVNDKHQDFVRKYSTIGLKIIRATGDSNDDVPMLTRGQYDICLMTYEKFTAILLGFPHILEQLGTLIIDEVQMIADQSRGVNLEFILTVLRLRRQIGIEPQLIALSAVIGHTNGFEKWLESSLLIRTTRPVPLNEGIILPNGDFKSINSETNEENYEQSFIRPEYRKGSSQDYIIPLVRRLVSEGKQVIVFREKRATAKGAANYLAEHLNLPPAQEAINKLPKGDTSVALRQLEKCLNGGVAFHISDLDRTERSIVEEFFREKDSKIRVITATTTLAMGVNTPAEAVIIAGLEHPSRPPKPYSIAEYKNIVGRAGRLGLSDTGSSYLLAPEAFQDHNYWHHYIKGSPEDIMSRFFEESTDPRSLIVRILVAANRASSNLIRRMSGEEIVDFLEFSFGSFQKQQLSPDWKWSHETLNKALLSLESHTLIRKDEEGYYRLTELGWLSGQAGIEVESIIRLVEILKAIPTSEITDQLLIAATQITVELDQIIFPVNSRGAQKEMDSWRRELYAQGIHNSVLSRLAQVSEPRTAALRFKKAVACLLWITEMPLPQIETVLTRHGGAFDGAAGPLRGAASRTHDLLATTARVAEIMNPGLHLDDRVHRLFTRLETGVPSRLVELAKHVGLAFSRADYQSFLKSNICEMVDIANCEQERLSELLGGDSEKMLILKIACEDFVIGKSFKDENVFIPSIPLYES